MSQRDIIHLDIEAKRLMRAMQTVSHVLLQGDIAGGLDMMLNPLIDAATEVKRLAAIVPAVTRIGPIERDTGLTAFLDANAAPTDLTVPEGWT